MLQADSFEDAILATLANPDLQSIVIGDGFGFRSSRDAPGLREALARAIPFDPRGSRCARLWPEAGLDLKSLRPELDIYLLTERGPELLAARPEAEAIRRIFYGREEVMEMHLAVLDGVGERYETPYFDNLKRYSRKPVGTFHALPVARGKSIFRSHWIRDMGEFYGVNLFMAESSATSGGLDSLLEPTGNIKRAQELAARAFGAEHAYFVTNGTSTSNKIVLQALLAPGDIVLIDRNCHKSHHYAMVLSGAQPLYLEAYPMTAYSMYGAVPLRAIKQALLALKAEGKLDRARMVDLTNCTFDGHMYNPRRVMEAVSGDQARPDLRVGRGLVRLRALLALPSPPHRDVCGRRAGRALCQRCLPARNTRRFAPRPVSSIRRTRGCSTCTCCRIRTWCASASMAPSPPTSRCPRCARVR